MASPTSTVENALKWATNQIEIALEPGVSLHRRQQLLHMALGVLEFITTQPMTPVERSTRSQLIHKVDERMKGADHD